MVVLGLNSTKFLLWKFWGNLGLENYLGNLRTKKKRLRRSKKERGMKQIDKASIG